MLKVGLTGGIACGKSLVRREFQRLGAATLDADRLARRAVEPGEETHRKIVEAFGSEIVLADGTLDRARLGRTVFGDDAARSILNGIVHPVVFRLQEEWLSDVEGRGETPIAVIDAALMIETGSYRRYDRIVVVCCDPEQQLNRLIQRDSLSRDAAQSRIASQMPIEEKKEFADFLIDNSGRRRETRRQTRQVYAQLLQIATGEEKD